MHTKKTYWIFLLLVSPVMSWAQLKTYPLESGIQKTAATHARVKSESLVSLPFWDDFSTATNHPSDNLWFINANVKVSSGMGVNPPSLNVATFDGLLADGTPYNPSPSDYLDFGYRDTLESQPIKMTEVTLPFRNSVFLSFYYQWKGHGEPPDENDFLRLEFKNNALEWETIATFQKKIEFDAEFFYDSLIRINADRFFHDDFRFRFISYGRRSGPYDAWQLDYVYLNQERTALDTSFPDRSVFIKPTSHFDSYNAIPASHFLASQTLTAPKFGLSNLEVINQPMNYQHKVFIQSFKETVKLSEYDILMKDSVSILPTLAPFEKRIVQTVYLPDFSNFDATADSIYMKYTITIRAGDTIRTDFGGIDFRVNDTLRYEYKLANYYAYDDGEAEYAAGLTQPGNQVAYFFEMKTTSQDTINGVDIYYPIFAGASPSNMELVIFKNQDGLPGDLLYEQLIPVTRTTQNAFTHVDFFQGVIVQGSFFIGYTEPNTGRVRVGLDKSNNTDDKLFYRVNPNPQTPWQPSDRIYGSLMIRPRFGKGEVVTALPPREENAKPYPNPTAGEFYIINAAQVEQVFTITGMPVHFFAERVGNNLRISLPDVSSGVYLIRYRTESAIYTEKIIVKK